MSTLVSVINSGTTSARPVAGVAGRLYFASDTGIIWWDNGTSWVNVTPAGGSVTSVGLSMPAEFSVAGSPVTSSGTLAVTKATESANTVWAGPSSGSAAAPTFRALVSADLPSGIGGVPSGTPIIPAPGWAGTNAGWNGFSLYAVIPGRSFSYLASSWKVTFFGVSGTGIHIAKAVVLRSLASAEMQSGGATVIDSTSIKFGGSTSYGSAFSGVTKLAPFLVTSDAIALTLDTSHDYCIMAYLDSDSNGYNAALSLSGAEITAPPIGFGHNSGDQTSATTFPGVNTGLGMLWSVTVA